MGLFVPCQKNNYQECVMSTAIERKQHLIDSLRAGRKYVESTGRRHCRLGIKPLSIASSYLDGYAKQFVRENSQSRPF